MKGILSFIFNNKAVLSGILLGYILGSFHWYYYGCYWGTYPLSSEYWVNCAFGALFGGFIISLFINNRKTS